MDTADAGQQEASLAQSNLSPPRRVDVPKELLLSRLQRLHELPSLSTAPKTSDRVEPTFHIHACDIVTGATERELADCAAETGAFCNDIADPSRDRGPVGIFGCAWPIGHSATLKSTHTRMICLNRRLKSEDAGQAQQGKRSALGG